MATTAASTRVLNQMSDAALTAAIRQILNSNKFWEVNSHIAITDRNMVRVAILGRNWSAVTPIFSPYAATHDGYSQGQLTLSLGSHAAQLTMHSVNISGTKHLVHRVTLRHFLQHPLDSQLEVSHIMHLGQRTPRQVFPW